MKIVALTGASRVAVKPDQQSWVVDSIEESVASIEVNGKTMITIPQSILPKGAHEGHVLRVTIEIDEAGTKKAIAASRAQTKKGEPQANDPGGDINL